jgi:hypothetical protein
MSGERQPPPLSTAHSSTARRVSVIMDSEGGKAAAAVAARTLTPPLLQTPPRVLRAASLSSSSTSVGSRTGGLKEDEGQVRLFHHAIRRRQEGAAIYLLRCVLSGQSRNLIVRRSFHPCTPPSIRIVAPS